MQLHTRVFAALVALTVTAVPAAAFAQTAPPDAPPPVAVPSYGTADETIHGRISSFDGGYSLQVRDDRGFIDNVQLQQGTVINPTGIRLQPGMSVTIHGVNHGAALVASQIDTPYQQYSAVPVGPYGYQAYPYPLYAYPLYPYPVYGYPYGPSLSVGIGFGGHHWR